MHPNGYMEIADRTKDVIKSGGEWISSVALENALMAHPKVQEAAVIAVPGEQGSGRRGAWVGPRAAFRAAVRESERTEHLASPVVKWWLPGRHGLMDELPQDKPAE